MPPFIPDHRSFLTILRLFVSFVVTPLLDFYQEVVLQNLDEDYEIDRTDKPTKTTNPEKLNVLRGSADSFASLHERGMGAEGLEPPTPSV